MSEITISKIFPLGIVGRAEMWQNLTYRKEQIALARERERIQRRIEICRREGLDPFAQRHLEERAKAVK